MNESRFLFVLDIIVLNLVDEGRRTYSLYYLSSVMNVLLTLLQECKCYRILLIDRPLTGVVAVNVRDTSVFLEVCERDLETHNFRFL